MSNSTLLLLLSPLLLFIIVVGIIWTIALLRARPQDVPTILKAAGMLFRRLTDHLPHRHHGMSQEEDQ